MSMIFLQIVPFGKICLQTMYNRKHEGRKREKTKHFAQFIKHFSSSILHHHVIHYRSGSMTYLWVCAATPTGLIYDSYK